MEGTGQHAFPGRWRVVEPHLKLPLDRRSFGELLDDMRPYESLVGKRQLAGIMLAHVVYEDLDSTPAGFSRYWIQNQLRD